MSWLYFREKITALERQQQAVGSTRYAFGWELPVQRQDPSASG